MLGASTILIVGENAGTTELTLDLPHHRQIVYTIVVRGEPPLRLPPSALQDERISLAEFLAKHQGDFATRGGAGAPFAIYLRVRVDAVTGEVLHPGLRSPAPSQTVRGCVASLISGWRFPSPLHSAARDGLDLAIVMTKESLRLHRVISFSIASL